MKEQNIAIDIGYGDTKVSIQRGSKTESFKFPSAIASVKEAIREVESYLKNS